MRVRYSFSSRKRTRVMDRHNQHSKSIPQLVRELIEKSDLILEVLDARFLKDTRNREMEEFVKLKDKTMIHIINKTDLVDIKELKKEIELEELYPFALVSCKDRRSGVLRERIKIEAKKIGKEEVNIGIIGYPNTGKSSIINLLTGKSSARTSKEAGFTKGIQKIKLADKIFIFDTPGVIREEETLEKNKYAGKLTRIGVRTFDKIKQPEFYVSELMLEYPGLFEKFYGIDAKGDSELLIEELGKKNHAMLSGGRVDTDRTARTILRDWQESKIRPE